MILKAYVTMPIQLCCSADRGYHFESAYTDSPYCGSVVVTHRLAVESGRGGIHLGKKSQLHIWGDLGEFHLLMQYEWQLSSTAGQTSCVPLGYRHT